MIKRPSSDILNPLVVKEIRQELRGRAFINLFLWSQIFLAGAVGLDLLTSSARSSSQLFVGLMWFILSGSLYFFFPARAWGTFNREEKANALELLQLTNMSSLQIVFGKWLATVSQGILIVSSMLPYLVLQYFVNKSDIVSLFSNVYYFCISFLLIVAIAICSSAHTKGRTFGWIGILAVFGLFYVGSAVYSASRLVGASHLTFTDQILLLVYIPLTVFQLLLVGASKIAPIQENYTAAKRLLTFLLLACTWLLLKLGVGKPPIIFLASLTFLGPIILSSCFENIHPLLARRAVKKPLVAWLAHPGWPQGMLFSLVVSILFSYILNTSTDLYSPYPFLSAFYIFVGIVFPRVLAFTFPKVIGKTLFAYTVIQIVLIVVPSVLESGASRKRLFNHALDSMPLYSGLTLRMSKTYTPEAGALLVSGLVFLLLLRAAYLAYRDVVRESRTIAERTQNRAPVTQDEGSK